MSEKQMTLQVEFPTWSQLSRPVKSLMNFFMSGASLRIMSFVNGMNPDSYNESTADLDSVSAIISGITSIGYAASPTIFGPEILVAYKNQESPDALYQWVGDDSFGEYTIKYNFESSLVECDTFACIYSSEVDVSESGYNQNRVPVLNSNCTVPVKIKPIIDNAVNEVSDVTVPNVTERGIHIACNDTADIDYQLRTSSFSIVTADYSGEMPVITKVKDLYFKVGVCPIEIEGQDALTQEECLAILKNTGLSFTCATDTNYAMGLNIWFDGVNESVRSYLVNDIMISNDSLAFYHHYTDGFEYSIYPGQFMIVSDIYTYEEPRLEKGDTRANLPSNLSFEDKFIVYFKLYNEDGTPEKYMDFTIAGGEESDSKYACIAFKDSNNAYTLIVGAWEDSGIGYLKFTDENIDGGYVSPVLLDPTTY